VTKISGGFQFAIDADNFITYASALNGKSVIRSLIVRATTAPPANNVTLEVSLHSLGHDLSQIWNAQIGTLGLGAVEFENLDLEFHADLLFQQKETVPAVLKVLLKEGDHILAESAWNIDLYSADSWLWGDSSAEILGAFVQPNHPILRKVLDESIDILKSRGEDTALSGYQIPKHVRPMVEAIYQGMVNQGLTYSNPPASWDLPGGQRIRNAQTILDEKVATCLDSALLFASLLENVGLYPVVALIPGHAFTGYWTAKYFAENSERFPIWTVTPIAEVINAVDNGYIELFETTSICIGEGQLSYDRAIKESHARISLTGGLSTETEESFLVNIVACRRMRPRPTRPMPATYVKSDGSTEVFEYQPVEFSVGMLKDKLSAEGAHGSASGAVGLNVPPVVKRWLDSLLDLSARNPLINFKEPKSCVPLLAAPEILGLIEDLLQNKESLTLANSPWFKPDAEGNEGDLLDDRRQLGIGQNSGAELAEALSKKILHSKFGAEAHQAKLRKMASSAKTFLEETGSNGLYLALGSLSWTTKEGRNVRSPLILVPVTVTPKNRSREFFLSIDEGSQVMPNFSLAEKLFRDEGVKLESLVNLKEDESGIDVNGTFAHVRKVIAGSGLTNFRVDENAVLGFFNFSTYRLWRDLLDNWTTFEKNSLVKHLMYTPNQEFNDPSVEVSEVNLDDLVSKLPIPSDASQARAIAQAMSGKTFILQGPPGTGKSQTITNLLARALSEGKRVLFVAEKKDALDVVKQRLDASGLGTFSLDLHDKGMNPKVVKEQLLSVIDIAITSDKVGYESARDEYENSLVPLQKYRNRLHEIGRLGESIHSALDKKLAVQSSATLAISGEFMSGSSTSTKEALLSSSKTLAELGPQAGSASNNPWSLTTCISDFSFSELEELKVLVRSMRSAMMAMQDNPNCMSFLNSINSIEELQLTKVLSYQESGSSFTADSNSTASREIQRNTVKSVVELKSAVDLIGFDISRLGTLDVDAWIGKAQVASTSFVLVRGLKQRGIFKKVCGILGTTIPGGKTDLMPTLESLKSLKLRKSQVEADFAKVAGVRIDATENLFDSSTLAQRLNLMSRLNEISNFASIKHLQGDLLQDLLTHISSEPVKALIQLGKDSDELFKRLETTQDSTELWQGDLVFGRRFVDCVPQWATDASEHAFAQMTRWMTLLLEAKPFTDAGLSDALGALLAGTVEFVDAPNAFLNGYYDTLVKALVVERGFNTFEAMTINNHVRKLENSHLQLRDRLPRITGAELLASRGFDSSMKVGAIGDLVAALKQPKNRIPIRTLLSKHWEVITRVTPCVLASPDSCVRFIDASLTPFDLVVFDEASQIRVANSIGAIGRAKSVIVVGDSKQMPPTSVAQVRVNDNDDDEEADDGLLAYDMESILDQCENARVPDIMLNWHYRSEDESLIAFSNKKYYDGKLNSFPSPSSDKTFKGLSFKYVEGGQFFRGENTQEKAKGLKGTNPAEIDAIIKYFAERLKDPATQNDSIGIVTFNKPQMEEIIRRLTDSPDPDIQRAMAEGVGGEEVFVKNLETVQGSERDVILFSVAFSKNMKGDLPLNFGPLTNAGGERRLNVAITRARKQVRIFCSFKPEELISRKSTATGVIHLGQYLKMANKEDDEFAGIYTIREPYPDRIRKQILAALNEAGLNAIEEVGLSDFKVDIAIFDPKDSSKAVLGILLDGPRWNARETVSDRDCLSVTLLRDRMGWPAIERIWLAAWLRNPGDEIQRIKEAYIKVLSTPKVEAKRVKTISKEPIYTVLDPEDVEDGENPIDRLLSEVEEWIPLQTKYLGDKTSLDYLNNAKVRKALQQIVHQLAEVEGPISSERLARFVGACFGFDRVVATRVRAINSIPYPGHERDKEGFLFPKGESPKTSVIWRRGTDLAMRNIYDISLSEIGNAMKAICLVAHGVRPAQLNKEVSRLFGVLKVSAAINERLGEAMNVAIGQGKLELIGEYIHAK